MTSRRLGLPALTQTCHFGEWLQGRIGPDGPIALVTLQPHGLFVRAHVRPARRLAVKVSQTRAGFPVSAPLLRRFLAALHLPASGQFCIRPPFAPGLGSGASTASLIAIARLAGYRGPPQVLARACVAAEGASDPLMFDHADRLLWASRQGQLLATGPAVPRLHLLAGFYGPARPTRASDSDYDDVSDLVARWTRARSGSDFAAIARESAIRCQARRGPVDDPTAQLAKDLGALGWSTSHSGAARALIFAPGRLPAHGPALMREAGLRNVQPLATGQS